MLLILAISKPLSGSNIIRDLYHNISGLFYVTEIYLNETGNSQLLSDHEIGHQRQIKIAYMKVSFLFTSAAGYKNIEQNRYFETHC